VVLAHLSAKAFDFHSIKSEFDLHDAFSADVLAEARSATDRHASDRRDRTDIPFVTIDPPGSMDLDQAVHIEKLAAGYLLHYAIADVGAFVAPEGALDMEARQRGQTFYLPDGSIPLHPRVMSEGSASLLPGESRPAALWRIELDEAGEPVSWKVTRETVRSVARFDYARVQADFEQGTPHTSIAALGEFGALRAQSAIRRGAIDLTLPEQDVVKNGKSWHIALQARTDVDAWNADVSLLTGMCAARTMLDAGVGLLRTLPAASDEAVETLKYTAAILGIGWPEGASAGAVLASLPRDAPTTLALMTRATTLLRGADYAAFDGNVPERIEHSGIAAPYAHVTAPLRRLSDRFATEICLAVGAGVDIPDWVRRALPDLPAAMRRSDSTASKVDRACIDLTEAVILHERVGERFSAVVLRGAEGKRPAEVFVESPIVMGKCNGAPPEGERVTVTLTAADMETRRIEFGYESDADAQRSVASTK